MKRINFLVLALLCLSCAHHQQEMPKNHEIRKDRIMSEEQPLVTTYYYYLFSICENLGCYFTLEYRGFPYRLYNMETTNDQSIATVPFLVEKLRQELPGFRIAVNAQNPKIVHIIEEVLEREEGYVMNKRTSVRYSGHLVPCVVKDKKGKNQVKGEGIVMAVARTGPGLEDWILGSLMWDDCDGQGVSASSETTTHPEWSEYWHTPRNYATITNPSDYPAECGE